MSYEDDETANKIGKFVREMQKDLDDQLSHVSDKVYNHVQDGTDLGLENIFRSVEESIKEKLRNQERKSQELNK